MKVGRKPKSARNATILALRGTTSYALIAAHLGISIGTVAGVCFRADYPLLTRFKRSGTHSKIGTGHHGPGRYPLQTKHTSKDTSP